MIKIFKVVVFNAVAVAAVSVMANAAEPGSTTAPYRPQIAANPSVSYSSARMPGPKSGPSNWIGSPSSTNPSSTAPTSGTESEGSYYSRKAFGPKPN
jgi:hypothetical protein